MEFKIGRINLNAVAQGVGGLVFGNDDQAAAKEDRQYSYNVLVGHKSRISGFLLRLSLSQDIGGLNLGQIYVERCLDRISNGVLAEDRHAAMTELQSIVAESHQAQLAFGAMGFPVIMSVLKEERADVEMVRGALETLIGALTPLDSAGRLKNELQPSLMNSDLLSRESDNISLLLSLLSEDDFYVRYYTLQLLTSLLTNSPHRLQEAILATPRGLTRLMDMLMDREVIRNEALLLLTYLTREAEEIQKIVVFEGGFEKIFAIVKEEGGSEGGVVVQDCIELLNNLLRNNTSNQILLRETVGIEPLISILKLRKGSAYNFTQQKTVNLLSVLEAIRLLLVGGAEADAAKDANGVTNQTFLAQNKVLDSLLMLGVESRWAPVAIRSLALHCIGELIARHPQNLDAIVRKLIGEEPHTEPALNAILRIILQTSDIQESIAADYVLKCFCERNPDGQAILTSTVNPQSSISAHDVFDKDVHIPFGSMLLHSLTVCDSENDLEICCRAANVLSHLLKDNLQCKERVLQIELEASGPSLVASEPLMHRVVKYLAISSSTKNIEVEEEMGSQDLYMKPIILRLLIIWLADSPSAVRCFLSSPAHLTYLIELLSSPTTSIFIHGLAATLLGECVIYNKGGDGSRDAFMVVDAISQRIGLTAYFHKFEAMRKSPIFAASGSKAHLSKPPSRSTSSEAVGPSDIPDEDQNRDGGGSLKLDHPLLHLVFDPAFVNFVKRLEPNIRESVVDLFSHPKNNVAIVPAMLEQKNGENDKDYIARLRLFVEKQCNEIQDLLGRNAALAEDLAKTNGRGEMSADGSGSSGRDRVQVENLRRELMESRQRIENLVVEKTKLESEASTYRQMVGKIESDLKSLSDAYNSLEQANFRLEAETKALRSGQGHNLPDLEAVRADAREEAERDSEAELNDLLVCLGQEQSKVERLSARLMELGEDVDSLLEGIGDEAEAGLPDEEEEE
ncbi:Golgin candidate 6 [Nymphaea thermarum]|nr:Golgin candidate 6 [Nymphaea thermarum]